MVLRTLPGIQAHLYDGNIGGRVEVPDHAPGTMVQAPAVVETHGCLFYGFPGLLRQGRHPGRRVLHSVQFTGKAAEIVDGARLLHGCYEGPARLPMGRYAEDGMGPRQRPAHGLPSAREFIVLDGIHRTSMADKQNGHFRSSWKIFCEMPEGLQFYCACSR